MVVPIQKRTSDCLFNMNTIQIGGAVIVRERCTLFLEFAGGEPMTKKLDEQAKVLGPVVFDLDTNSHQWFREFAEGVASGAYFIDESDSLEFADLFGSGLVRHQARCRYVLNNRGLALEAKELNNFALGRGELTHSVLVVRRQIINHIHERLDEVP